MLDSWGICQPSAWAFQTMPHNVLDSPEKQPGAWKLPAHHLNSLIWALSGAPTLVCVCARVGVFVCVYTSLAISLNISFSSLPHPPSSHFCHRLYLTFPLASVFSFGSFLILRPKCYNFLASTLIMQRCNFFFFTY